MNKDRVDDELVNGIVNPSKDDGAMKIFQSTYTGDPKPRPMEVLPKISQNVKIGAIWGKQDNVISPKMNFAQKVKQLSSEEPERFHWNLIDGGHVLHDD